MGIIYKVTNRINGMIYIGQRKTTPERFLTSWYYGGGKYISLALERYGKENFSKDILDEHQCQDQLDQKEKYWIDFYGSLCPNGYNIANGAWGGNNGGQNKGKHWSSETRAKISATLKRKYASGELLPAMLGKKHSEEAHEKIKQKRKIQIISQEAREKATKTRLATYAVRGYGQSEESRRKIGLGNSVALKRYYANGGKHSRIAPREIRTCICGCGYSFECKVRSKRKYYKANHRQVSKRESGTNAYTGQPIRS